METEDKHDVTGDIHFEVSHQSREDTRDVSVDFPFEGSYQSEAILSTVNLT